MKERKPVIKKLSKGVLDLKFMKKTKERAGLEEDAQERQFLYQDQLSALQNSSDKVVIVGSHYDVMSYLPCRLSFGGMEPSIEKLNIDRLKGLYEIPKEELEDNTNEVDVSNEEMAEHFSTLHENIANKFKRTRHGEFIPPNKRKKRENLLNPADTPELNTFLKPED